MFFWLNRIIHAFADDDEIFDGELVATRRACVFAHRASDVNAGFLRQLLEPRPHFSRDLLLHQDALHEAGTVACNYEGDFAVTARGLDPTAHGNAITDVLAEIFYFTEN